MVLEPLEFSECIADTPWFRQNLYKHEIALEGTYKSIKNIEVHLRKVISCSESKFPMYQFSHFSLIIIHNILFAFIEV
ncbi:unnamed protein product [Strongylus vulgaris]|uniref:BAR domain-containing protein n=1 Tax=Strongylus vulgaris TaxID=40348 RepID=A0A3P7KHR4_STRVU|nr:unnamed protein product [Strongylus vulgaris]